MKKYFLSFALIALLAAGCNSAATSNSNSNSANTNTPVVNKSSSNSNVATADKQYTMAEVAAANSTQKCWTVINGSVYDVTKYIFKHKGGSQKILSLCGKDGTSAFSGQHNGQPKPEAELANFKIGTLKK